MEKKPEVDGKWLEVETADIIAKAEDLSKCEIGVVKNGRLEMGAEDMSKFMSKFEKVSAACAGEMEGMDDSQKSFYVFRKMVLS